MQSVLGARASMFRPMARPMPSIDASERRRMNRQMDGSSRVMPEESPDALAGRDPARVMWVFALAHALLCSPSVIIANVNHWMSWRIFNHQPLLKDERAGVGCNEAFDLLVRAILNDGIDFQVKLRRVEDRIHATTRISYELSTMYNTESHRLSEFACSETVLLRATRAMGGVEPEWRLRTILLYLFCGTEQNLFSHVENSIDNNGAHYRNFLDNDLLEMCLDHSATFVAFGVYLATYLGQALSEKERLEDEVPPNPARISLANAQLEAGQLLMDKYADVVEKLREKCADLAHHRSDLREDLCVYDHEHPDYVAGVPTLVVQNEILTLLWLKWAWAEHVKPQRVPMLTLLQDLWTAKSAVLLDRYHDFFEGDQDFDQHILNLTQALAASERPV